MTDVLDKLISEVTMLRGASAIVVFIIMLGYALKMIPRFPNKAIPVVSFIVGPLLTPLMVGWPTTGSMDSGLRWPEQAAWASSIIQGFLLACLAWIMHAKVLRKLIDDKIPALNPGRTTETSEREVTVTDEKGEVVTAQQSEERVTEVPTGTPHDRNSSVMKEKKP